MAPQHICREAKRLKLLNRLNSPAVVLAQALQKTVDRSAKFFRFQLCFQVYPGGGTLRDFVQNKMI